MPNGVLAALLVETIDGARLASASDIAVGVRFVQLFIVTDVNIALPSVSSIAPFDSR